MAILKSITETPYAFVTRQFESEQEADKFCLWAFGEGYETEPLSKIDDRWNERHSNELLVQGHDSVPDTLLKMIEIYKGNME